MFVCLIRDNKHLFSFDKNAKSFCGFLFGVIIACLSAYTVGVSLWEVLMKYFGTDGIRGIANQTLTVDFCVRIGKAMSIFKPKKVYVATDTRQSKDALAYALIGGCLSVGIDVVFLHILSTPALIYLSRNGMGMMITASHNPFFYNGIKILNHGRKLNKEEETMFEQALKTSAETLSDSFGEVLYEQPKDSYFSLLKEHARPFGQKVVIDCANGAVFQIAPEIFSRFGKTKVICANPNGKNINDDCGSTHLDRLSREVLKSHYDLGFAFDGDGDRVLGVDDLGNFLTGDHLLYLLACYLKQKQLLPQNKVVLTCMSNLGMIEALNRQGIDVIETDVGDHFVYEALERNSLVLGGETSGHIFLHRDLKTGDGVFVALWILRILEETKKKIRSFFTDVCWYDTKSENISVSHRQQILKDSRLWRKIAEIKDVLGKCRVIVRPSGTEPVLRVMMMAKDSGILQEQFEDLLETISRLDEE